MRRECTVVRYTTFVVPVNAETDAEAEAKALTTLSHMLDHHYIVEEEYNVVSVVSVVSVTKEEAK
jgi:hypothetical protein